MQDSRVRLSRRGRRLVDAPPVPQYLEAHFAHADDRWHGEHSPDGYVGLCVAENKLHGRALIDLLAGYSAPASVLGYDDMAGNRLFRERLAAFMGRSFLGRTFDADQLVVVAGAGSALELLFYTICDPGDGVLVPTPSYAGFWADLETRNELQLVTANCDSADGFALTTAHLDAALQAADCRITALLLTNPSNPLGQLLRPGLVAEIVDWAERRDIQLVMDEIYALSVFGERPFTSAAAARPRLGDNVHIVWAFSKDFGASGLRCGVLVSENTAVLQAVGGLAFWAACSGHTQHLLSELVADAAAVDGYLAGSQNRLRHAYDRTTAALDAAGIVHLPAEAAFFLICDLREQLAAPSWEAEHRLWQHMLESAKVNLTPGAACRINEPGFFRLCYAAEPTDGVEAAIARLARIVGAG